MAHGRRHLLLRSPGGLVNSPATGGPAEAAFRPFDNGSGSSRARSRDDEAQDGPEFYRRAGRRPEHAAARLLSTWRKFGRMVFFAASRTLGPEGSRELPGCRQHFFLAFLGAFLGVAAQVTPPPVPRAPQQPPRDPVRRAEPAGTVGTGVIKGRVVAADTGNPIRRVTVSLSMVPMTGGRGGSGTAATMVPGSRGSGPAQMSAAMAMVRPRQATTDMQGSFEFTGVAAGTYRIQASPSQYSPQYLAMAYGGTKPTGTGSMDIGQPIQLAEGQSFDKAVIALPRGAVITGRVTDENAEPLARVQVYTLYFPPGSGRGMRMGSGSQTDDLGQFRIYGLVPGEHAVAAEANRFNFVPPNAPPETEEDKIGFVTTYYPGTADEGSAQRVRARVGTETPGIEIRLAQSRLYRIAGSVVDSQGRALPHVNGQVMRRTPGMSGGSSFGFSTDEQGQFQMRNVPSGNYRLIIRQTRPFTPGPQNDPGEMASLPLTIAGADMDNVLVMTTPGVTISGLVVFDARPAAHDARHDPHHGDARQPRRDVGHAVAAACDHETGSDLHDEGPDGRAHAACRGAGQLPQVRHGWQRRRHGQRTRVQGERPRHDYHDDAGVDGGRERDRRHGRGVHGRRHHYLFGGQGVVAVQLHADQAVDRRPDRALPHHRPDGRALCHRGGTARPVQRAIDAPPIWPSSKSCRRKPPRSSSARTTFARSI